MCPHTKETQPLTRHLHADCDAFEFIRNIGGGFVCWFGRRVSSFWRPPSFWLSFKAAAASSGLHRKIVSRFTGTFVRVCTQFYFVFTPFVVRTVRGNIKSKIGEMRIIKEASMSALFQAGDLLKYGKILFYISYGNEIACYTPETMQNIII